MMWFKIKKFMKLSYVPAHIQCPYCEKFNYLSILSHENNTFHSDFWSDSFVDYGMYPPLYSIFLCKSCRKYYLADFLGYHYKKGKDLNYPEIKEAITQFKQDGTFENQEISLRRLFLFKYNDWFFRGKTKGNIPCEEDKSLFKENGERLIELTDESLNGRILRAELYREMSMFKECCFILRTTDGLHLPDSSVPELVGTEENDCIPNRVAKVIMNEAICKNSSVIKIDTNNFTEEDFSYFYSFPTVEFKCIYIPSKKRFKKDIELLFSDTYNF